MEAVELQYNVGNEAAHEHEFCRRKKGDAPFNLRRANQKSSRLVQRSAPITGEQIAERSISRPTIRSDLSVLVMLGYLDAAEGRLFPGKHYGRRSKRAIEHSSTGRPEHAHHRPGHFHCS